MATLRRKIKKNTDEACEYKPSLYPSFTVHNSEGVNLKLNESNMDKMYNAKVKLTGVNKRTTSKKREVEWTFEIQSIDS